MEGFLTGLEVGVWHAASTSKIPIVKGKVKTYKEVNIHGKINTELDEVDLVKKIIYKDKPASKLYMKNPDFPQIEAQ